MKADKVELRCVHQDKNFSKVIALKSNEKEGE
jgi:hypothetical protein